MVAPGKSNGSKGPQRLNRPLDRDKNFTGVFVYPFPYSRCGNILDEEEIWSRQARVTVRKGNNF